MKKRRTFHCGPVRKLAARFETIAEDQRDPQLYEAMARLAAVLCDACDEVDALRDEVKELRERKPPPWQGAPCGVCGGPLGAAFWSGGPANGYCCDGCWPGYSRLRYREIPLIAKPVTVETRPGGAVILRCLARGCRTERPIGRPFCDEHKDEDAEDHV